MKQHKFLLFMVMLLLLSSRALAELKVESGIYQNQLIELYTSEGCSSCPPAETYLNSMLKKPGLWKDYIPVAFHVDYWNNLGWRDRFSAAAYSARQRTYARHWRSPTVYTPEFFVNGHEWRRWYGSALSAGDKKRIGNLQAHLQNGQVTASFNPQVPVSKRLILHVAVLGLDRKTQIKSGENAGRDAIHHFVVLGHKSFSSDNRMWTVSLPQRKVHEEGKEAIAIWVTEQDSPLPLQSAGGFMPR